MLRDAMDVSERKAETLLRAISKAKRMPAADERRYRRSAIAAYARAMARAQLDRLRRSASASRCARCRTIPRSRAHYRERFRFISVDEFQDIDEQQYRLLTLLAPPGANLCVIGDPDQAIYGFRGADASCFARFRQRLSAAGRSRLARNYRSSGTIVAASAQMLGARRADARRSCATMHERITIHAAPTERAEAEFVVQTIEGLIGGHSFFSIDSGRAGSGDDQPVVSRISRCSTAPTRSRPRWSRRWRAPACRSARTGKDALDPEDRIAEAAPRDERGDRVSLLTLHAAKGLEFRVVFIVGLEDGILPLRFGPGDDTLAEERRLFYVGMTRAEDRLILTRAQQRKWRGRVQALPRLAVPAGHRERIAQGPAQQRAARKAGEPAAQSVLNCPASALPIIWADQHRDCMQDRRGRISDVAPELADQIQ